MMRPGRLVILPCAVAAGGCSEIAAIAAPRIVFVTINAPAGLLVGEPVVAATA